MSPERRVQTRAGRPPRERQGDGTAADLALRVTREIGMRARRYYPGLSAGGGPVVSLDRADLHGYSVLLWYALRFPENPRPYWIVAKVRRASRYGAFEVGHVGRHALERGREEFAGLRHAYRFFNSAGRGLGVVRPLDYLPEFNATVMEKAAGEDLAEMVRHRRPAAEAAVRRCGEWLRLFHADLNGATTRTLMPGEATSLLQRRLRSLADAGVAETLLQSLEAAADGFVDAVAPAPVAQSLLHGDFKLRHVWATSDAIQVLDFGNGGPGDCLVDVAAFLVELDVYNLWSMRARSDVTALHRAFLAGYFGPHRAPPLLAFYVVDALLKKWERRRRRWSSTAAAVLLQRAVRACCSDEWVARRYLDTWFERRIRPAMDLSTEQPWA